MNHSKKKMPYFIGIGMIVAGIISMIISGKVGDEARPFIVFAGVMIFVAGFAGTVIYSTKKDTLEDKNEKRVRSPAEKLLWLCGGICLAGLVTLIAGFILFENTNFIVLLIGMAAFLGGGSAMISIFSKHSEEFLKKDDTDNNEGGGES